MEHIPLVTIAIPVYNCEKTIQKTIKSVLAQSFSDYELLICDDGSFDNTINIIKEFSDPRIKLFKDSHNKGIASRLNQLIELASGDYFFRMDGDDIMFPDRVEKQVKYLQDNLDVDIVGTSAVVIDENDNILGKRGGASRLGSFDDLFKSARFIHPTVAGKTEWFRRWKYDENLSGCEDMDLWIRSYKESIFSDYNEPLLFYRESLKIRLKTYLRRQKLLLQYSWSRRNLMDHWYYIVIQSCKLVVSSIAAIILHMTQCDKKMIRRRNSDLTREDVVAYNAILNKILLFNT